MDDINVNRGLTRRAALTGIGAGAAAVWSAPALLSVSRAGAAASAPPPPPGDSCTFIEEFGADGGPPSAHPAWGPDPVLDTTPSGRNYMGPFSADGAGGTLTLAGCPDHSSFDLEFDFYGFRSLDGFGDPPAGGRVDESFRVTIDGNEYYRTNFAIYGSELQAYPDVESAGIFHPARTGAIENGTLGLGTGDFGDAVWRISFAGIPHAGGTITIRFEGVSGAFGQSWQGVDDEAWGLDNVRVVTHP